MRPPVELQPLSTREAREVCEPREPREPREVEPLLGLERELAAASGIVDGTSAFAELLRPACGERRDEARPQAIAIAASSGAPAATLEVSADTGRLTPQSARQLVRVVWDAARTGRGEVELRLRTGSRELGNLQLRVRVQGNQVHVLVRAASAEVARLIVAARQDLADGLARWRLVLAQLEARGPERDNDCEPPRASETASSTTAASSRRSFIEVVA